MWSDMSGQSYSYHKHGLMIIGTIAYAMVYSNNEILHVHSIFRNSKKTNLASRHHLQQQVSVK